jgi:uncharacterized protein (TIGR03067 family)
MKRLLVLFLALGLLAGAVSAREDDKPKDKKADKKDDKKDDKKKDEKKDEKKDDKKKEDKKEPEKQKELSEEGKKDLEKMSGTFTVISFVRNGEAWGPDKLKKLKVVQKGANWSFTEDNEVTEGTDWVDPSKKPKEVDSTYTSGGDKGKKALGIYEIDGDTVKFCHAEPDKPRPTEFASKAGSDQTLMVLKRAKEGEKPKDDKKDDKKKDEKKDGKKDK